MALHYSEYYELIEKAAQASTKKRKTLEISWHNTGDYVIGNDAEGNPIQMPDIVLSNLGDENRPDTADPSKTVSCDPDLLMTLSDNFAAELAGAGMPVTSTVNYGFSGGYETQRYSSDRNPRDFRGKHSLQALQVEYNTKLTHNNETLEEIPGRLVLIKGSFERALIKTLDDGEMRKLGWCA
mgnify:CR=1 FL=1